VAVGGEGGGHHEAGPAREGAHIGVADGTRGQPAAASLHAVAQNLAVGGWGRVEVSEAGSGRAGGQHRAIGRDGEHPVR
nr:hypothetical protein [Tanacetum cinerariifolium]